MSFLLDTDTCSAYVKGNTLVWNRFIQHSGGLHISTVTLGEMFTWAKRGQASPRRLQGLLDLLNDVQVFPFDEAAAQKFGEVRAGLLDAGLSAPVPDLMIAATALVHGLIVVTHNTTDYAHVPGLTSVDWLIP